MKQATKIDFDTCKLYFYQTTLAIEYLHSQNPAIIHRDIKPENLILFGENTVKVTDFGWSNTIGQDRNTYCGTPDYLAPEMINGIKHGTEIDIWALGVLLYELVVGKAPFSNEEGTPDYLVRKELENNILVRNFTSFWIKF